MQPSNPLASVALFQNCESVAIAPLLSEENPTKSLRHDFDAWGLKYSLRMGDCGLCSIVRRNRV
jgi:hypothetical protein